MRKGITFKGKHSYRDFGLTIKSRHIGVPPKKKIKTSVPFQIGSYDFSRIYGAQAYEERPIQYVFQIRGKSTEEMEAKQQAALDWLLHSPKVKLEDDYLPGLYFMAECESAEPNDLNFILELTVNFMAYPFKFGEHLEGNDIWDSFNFLTDYAQTTKFDVSGSKEIKIWNPSAIPIAPTIIASAPMEIVKGNTIINIPAGKSTDWRFYLDIGENKMTINGNGSIEFLFRKEVV